MITDYEYHTPKAAKLLGLNCLCVGHQPIQHKCVSVSIPNQFISRVTTRVYNLCVHSNADKYLIDSFYYLPPLDEKNDRTLSACTQERAVIVEPTRGDHILVYLTSPACEELLKCLAKLKIPVKFTVQESARVRAWSSTKNHQRLHLPRISLAADMSFVMAGTM